MKLSTTNEIFGHRITKHLGILTERVVVGAGFYSEIFASFTDTFGGRSKKFEQRINELHQTALNGLVKKAIFEGANGIVGIKFDVDQIATKRGSMFMLNVIGTKVLCELNNEIIEDSSGSESDSSNAIIAYKQEVNSRLNAIEIVEQFNKHINSKPMNIISLEHYINRLIEENTYDDELANKIFEVIFNNQNKIQTASSEVIFKYLNEYDSNLLSKVLVDNMISIIDKGDEFSLGSLAYQLYEKIDNLNICEIERLVRSVDMREQYVKIQMFFKSLNSKYTVSDLQSLKNIVDYITTEVILPIEEIEKVVSSNSWKCKRCGTENKTKNEMCKCGASRDGYYTNEKKLIEIKNFIEKLIYSIGE